MRRKCSYFMVLLLCFALMPNLAADWGASSNMVSSYPGSEAGYLQYLQGDRIVFSVSVAGGLRSGGPAVAGLTADHWQPEDLISTTGEIDTSHFLYRAEATASPISLSSADIEPGRYRFYYIHTWGGQNAGSANSAFFYQDLEILPREVPDAWAEADIKTTVSNHLIPTELLNRYTSPIIRSDFAKLAVQLVQRQTDMDVYQLLGRRGLDIVENPFTDVTQSYFRDALGSQNHILVANKLGILGGKGDGIFDPKGQITRQEAANMLWRTAKSLGVDSASSATSFADQHLIADWAQEAVGYVVNKQIMSGTGNNEFSPTAPYTYQQAYLSMLRMYRSMAGELADISWSPIEDTAPLAMNQPIATVGHSFTIVKAGINNEFDTSVLQPKADEKVFVVSLKESDPDHISALQLFAMFEQCYLVRADGTKQNYALKGAWGPELREIAFLLPADMPLKGLSFVCAGQWRKLDAETEVERPAAADAKAMSEPLVLQRIRFVLVEAGEKQGNDLLKPQEGMTRIYLRFETEYPEDGADGDPDLYGNSYLLADDNSRYRCMGSKSVYGELLLGFQIPEDIDWTQLVFIYKGENAYEIRTLK